MGGFQAYLAMVDIKTVVGESYINKSTEDMTIIGKNKLLISIHGINQ